MHILTNKSGKICINSENIFLGGLRRHLQYKFPHSKFVKFYVTLLTYLRDFKLEKWQKRPSHGHNGARDLFPMYTQFD
jgi:hypothetical protein